MYGYRYGKKNIKFDPWNLEQWSRSLISVYITALGIVEHDVTFFMTILDTEEKLSYTI